MKKYLLFLFALIAICSCSKENTKLHENVFTYTYRGAYTYEINLYKGKGVGKVNATEAEAQKMFFVPFNFSGVDKVVIDLNKDSIYEINSHKESRYKIGLRNDSVFYLDYHTDKTPIFAGVFGRDKSEYQYCKAVYFRGYQDDFKTISTSASTLGSMSYSDNFKTEDVYFSDKYYGFSSPQDMKNKNDVVCWVNLRYALVRN